MNIEAKPRSIATAMDFGSQLVKALGLPDNCMSIDLHVEAGEIVTVTARHAVLQQGQEFFDTIAAEYDLVRKSAPAAQPQEFHFGAWLADRKDVAHAALMDRCRALGAMDARMVVA
jgi:hypothetical protein